MEGESEMAKKDPQNTVRVSNKTRGTVLAQKAKIANTPLLRLRGLLGRSFLDQGEGLIIEPCSSIHTCFMRFPIDVLFLDNNNKIVLLANNLPPWRLFGTLFKGKIALELPTGTVIKTETKVGDFIEIN